MSEKDNTTKNQFWKNEEEKYNFLKSCFEECDGVKWKEENLKKVAKKLGVNNINELISYCKMYAIEYLCLSEEEFNYYYQEYCNEVLIKPNLLKKTNGTYYLAWRNERERKSVVLSWYDLLEKNGWTFKSLVDFIITPFAYQNNEIFISLRIYIKEDKQIKEKISKLEQEIKNLQPIQLKKANPVLKKISNTEDVYFSWRDDKERKIVTKSCYLFATKNLYSENAIEHLAKNFGASSREILRMISLYGRHYLKQSKEIYYANKRKIESFSIPYENEILKKNGIPGVFANWLNTSQRQIVLEYCYRLYSQDEFDEVEYLKQNGLFG